MQIIFILWPRIGMLITGIGSMTDQIEFLRLRFLGGGYATCKEENTR